MRTNWSRSEDGGFRLHRDSRPQVQDVAFDVARPHPQGTMASLASLGYSPQDAVADIVDNSVAAGANEVRIRFHWAGADHTAISISDNGRGMSLGQLVRGMTVGGTGAQTSRHDGDLGRFGMGLKTASFSQCAQLVVSSRTKAGEWSTRTWDIEHVLAAGDWELIHGAPREASAELSVLQTELPNGGTIVLWRKLTRLIRKNAPTSDNSAKREFYKAIRKIESHLGMTFARFITAEEFKFNILINENPVSAWDPFFSDSPYVDRLPVEWISGGVAVQGFVMPHHNRLNEQEFEAIGGPEGWIDQQGFYVYRENRLIVSGGWLELGFKNDERHARARICVDISNADDATWQIDIRKSKAVPPLALQPSLKRLAKLTRERSIRANAHRRTVAASRGFTETNSVWIQQISNGNLSFCLNRDHPLLINALKDDGLAWLSAYLTLVEQALPLALIRNIVDVEIPSGEANSTSRDLGASSQGTTAEDGHIPRSVLDLAEELVVSFRKQGLAGATAIRRVVSTPPFDQYPQLTDALLGHQD